MKAHIGERSPGHCLDDHDPQSGRRKPHAGEPMTKLNHDNDNERPTASPSPFPRQYMSRASLAYALDISESTVDELVRRGRLPPPIRLSRGRRALVFGRCGNLSCQTESCSGGVGTGRRGRLHAGGAECRESTGVGPPSPSPAAYTA